MRLLFCSPVIPSPPTSGLKIRVFNLARELARDHDVHLFCLSEEPATPEQEQAMSDAGIEMTVVSKPCNSMAAKLATYARQMAALTPPEFILSWEREISAALARLKRDRTFDVAVAEHLFMARYTALLDFPRVMVLHNIESDLAATLASTYPQPARSYKRAAARWARSYEKRMLGRMQGAVTVTEADLARMRELAPDLDAAVVENGVDRAAFGELYIAPQPDSHRLLYLGLMSYESNIDAVEWFVRETLPLVRSRYADTRFTIAGADPTQKVLELDTAAGVSVTGFVDDIKALYRENDILVVPLRLGGGSRLKILEAFAAGTPAISTAKGAEGLAVEDGLHLLIADTPEAQAAAVGRLFSEPQTAAALRKAALGLVEERYDWPILAGKLARFLERVAGRG